MTLLSLKKIAETVSAKIKSECPDVKWKESYSTMGRYDVVDIIESDDPKQVMKAAIDPRPDRQDSQGMILPRR